ncbi:MAG: AAA family ATPase, partial [Propionivibrio sp.]
MQVEPGHRFIGRQRELDALLAALERAVAGQPAIALLTGEPGIGKTQLAQEFAAQAARREVLALWGRCPEQPGAPPYWPWLQMIRRYLAACDGAELAATLGSAATYIATLDPELRDRIADGTALPVEEIDSAKARFRLFDSLAGFWRRAAARQPLLLLIDDLHLADAASLHLLEFVMAELGDSRMLLLGTYRDAEVGRQHPLSATLAELQRHLPVQRLLLGGFSPAESAQFVAESMGVASSELTAMLYDKTGGHPLFLVELTRDFQQNRGISPTTQRLDMSRVPQGVREVIGTRLNRLTPACVNVLHNAAVFGRTFRRDLLRRMLDDRPEDDGRVALDEAQAAGLIEARGEPESCQFSHALVRDVLYDELPAVQRARLHRKIGEVLEECFAADLTAYLSQLAYHYHAAGPCGDLAAAAKAIDYATRAAERAMAMQAYEEASRQYLRACTALSAGTAADAPRCRLLLGLGKAQNSAGDSTQALATFSEAAACARRLGDASLLASAAIGFGEAQWRLASDGERAVALIREALALAEAAEATDGSERAALLTALCQALLFANRPDEGE